MTTAIVTTHETEVPLDDVIGELAASFRGELLRPGDPDFATAARLWNGLVERRPALVARCADTGDVQAAVRVAAARDLLVAVRGGGHNVAGTASADGGIVIDLSAMDEVRVDPAERRARVGGGATWAQLDAATQAHGLAAPGGVVSDTGVGGLTLGGGIGWLRRRHGLACDNLLAARVVTADGTVREVDEATDPELLWGLRGGGGNLGIVTELTYALHPVGPDVFTAFVLYHGDHTTRVLRGYRDVTQALADEVSSFAICGVVPEAEDFPEETWGEPYALVMAVASADPATGQELVQPMRELAPPMLDMSDVMPFVQVQQLLDEDYPTGLRYYWKSAHLPALSDEAIELVAQWAARAPSALSTLDVWHLGGAMARVPADATAYGDRSAPFLVGVEANWEAPADDDTNIAWTRDCVAAFEGLSTGREYLNFPGFFEGGDATLRRAYGDANYRRLAELKRRVDPDNLLRLHHNVPPA